MKKNLLKNLIALTVTILTVGVSSAWAQLPVCEGGYQKKGNEYYCENNFSNMDKKIDGKGKNPNNFPACPEPDNTKKIDTDKILKWNNCWGRFTFETLTGFVGLLLEGEFKNGKLHGLGFITFADAAHSGDKYIGQLKDGYIDGQGTYYFLAENKFKGDKYVGDHKNGFPNGIGTYRWANGDEYIGSFKDGKKSGKGTLIFSYGAKYVGEWHDDKPHGNGTYTLGTSYKYEGEWFDGLKHGKGKENFSDGRQSNEGIFIKGKFANADNKIFNSSTENLVDSRDQNTNSKETKNNFEKQEKNSQRINLQVTNTQANVEGDFVINIQTGTDTASLKINGEEFGGKADGNYIIKKVARAGQETKFTIVAKDTNGNTNSKTIAVTRQVTASNTIKYAELNPALIKTQPSKDAVAIVIGIADYKNLPRADYANDDARAFYDYAIRALGVKPENIKLLVDADAGQGEIYKAFKTWLPSRVKATTDVYVYYSGHGLPAADGQSLYLLPQLADRDLIEETAIAQSKINTAIQATRPKSVTIFLDSCYSGAGRTGVTLLASARPIAIKSTAQAFPTEFTVISASTAEQISSSSNELKHGIFSYYLMRGMEGEADTNKDGKITTGEMHGYLIDNVARQASLANRVQQPQLSGDANRVLVGK
jgi:hypothetical protein